MTGSVGRTGANQGEQVRLGPMDRDAQRLSVFLRNARARISPASAGLPVSRRRVAGLRAEEVAELIGVSGTWYARCESGAAQLSIAALERLAGVQPFKSKLAAIRLPERQIAFDDGTTEEWAARS